MGFSDILTNVIRSSGDWVSRNSSSILTGLIVSGVVTTGVLSAQGMKYSMQEIEDREIETGELVERKDAIKMSIPYYIPAATIGGMTIACVFGLNYTHAKRMATLAGLYSFTESSLKGYRSKLIEELGPKKAQKIDDSIAQDILDQNPSQDHTIIETGYGNTLCYDVLSGRYFRSDIETIKSARNDFNYKLMNQAVRWLSVNDLYYELNLAMIELGDDKGWNTDRLLEMDFYSKLSDKGEPCLVIKYPVTPRFLNYL